MSETKTICDAPRERERNLKRTNQGSEGGGAFVSHSWDFFFLWHLPDESAC